MEVFKPREQRLTDKQKLKRRKASTRPRGAVLKSASTQEETLGLQLRKQSVDFFKELERVTGFVNMQVLSVFALLLLVALGYVLIEDVKTDLAIEKVAVKGDFKQLDREVLEETLAPLVGSNYFDLNVGKLKDSLLQFAWVQSVEVRKLWPAQVVVVVTENRAIARWGAEALVNEFGEVFKPKTMNREFLEDLPDLNGMDKQSDLVLQTYVNLSTLSLRHKLDIAEFSLVANNFWRIRFDKGIELYLPKGDESHLFKIFLEAYARELNRDDQVLARVDMRYSNGFSVKFGKPHAQTLEIGIEDSPSNNIKASKNHG